MEVQQNKDLLSQETEQKKKLESDFNNYCREANRYQKELEDLSNNNQ